MDIWNIRNKTSNPTAWKTWTINGDDYDLRSWGPSVLWTLVYCKAVPQNWFPHKYKNNFTFLSVTYSKLKEEDEFWEGSGTSKSLIERFDKIKMKQL